jgi:hypothetical protein
MKTQFNIGETIAAQRRIVFVAEYPHELQELDLGDIAAADTFTLTYKGQTTSAITFAADMTTAITTALEALSNIEDDDVVVTKEAGVQDYFVGLGGTLIGAGIGLLSITPTGFTPTGVTRHGYAGSPATGLTFAAADIQVSKNGAADANSAGSVVEIGYGRYYYQATLGEVDTRGTLSLATVREDIAVCYPTIEIVAGVLRSGTAQAGGADSLTLDAAASSVSDFYLPCTVVIRAGTGAGQGPRFATAYNGVSKVLTVTPDWAVVPSSDSEFELLPSLPLASTTEVVDALEPSLQQAIVGGSTPLSVSASGTVDAQLVLRRSL